MKTVFKKKSLMSGVMLGALLLSSCGRDPIEVNFNDYISADYTGYDGLGKAEITFNYKEALNDLEGKVSEEEFESARRLFRKVSIEADKVEGLSNGDSIDIEWDVANKSQYEEIGIVPKYSNDSLEVKSLSELAKYDIFKGIEIAVDGYNGYNNVYLNRTPNSDYSGYFEYTIENNQNVKNGDTVKVKAYVSYGEPLMLMQNAGLVPESMEYSFKVQGVEEVKEVDPFEYINVNFKGFNMDGVLTSNWNYDVEDYNSQIEYNVSYSFDTRENLVNGDVVKATATLTGSTEEEFARRYGIKLAKFENEYVVSGLDESMVYRDENGHVVDLGGMQIVVRDWWSSGYEKEPTNDYEEARLEWIDYIQETYNFTIQSQMISDWSSAPSDFIDYVNRGDDGNSYVFVLYDTPSIASAMRDGYMYDLATIPWLDFSKEKFTKNKTHELYTMKGSIYGMAEGYSEPRAGVFFNKQLLINAGINPDDLYDMQTNGTWTWDEFDKVCAAVQKDVDGDGWIDYYAITCDESVMTSAAVWSNNGSYVGKNKSGYYYNLESAETQEALKWVVDMYNKYDDHTPEWANWDYYLEEFMSGNVAFFVGEAYNAMVGNTLNDVDFEMGFLMFPKGPRSTTMVNCWANNIIAIPACYSQDKAEKIAFAWNLYTDRPEGYEDYKDLSGYNSNILDSRAMTETIPMMMEPEHGIVTYHALIPELDLGPDFTWSVAPYADIAALTDEVRGNWKKYIKEANR